MSKSKPAIIFYFPCCAGGKFLINSLSLSRHMVPQDIKLAHWDVEQTVYDRAYYDRKLSVMLNTVPNGPNDTGWLGYELGTQLKWHDRNHTSLQPILAPGRHCFPLIAHEFDQIPNLRQNFPNSVLIKSTNYTKWQRVSSFKQADFLADVKNKIAYWQFVDKKELQGPRFYDLLLDVDNNYPYADRMQDSMGKLYAELGFDDWQPELWKQYYDRYIKVHSHIDEIYSI